MCVCARAHANALVTYSIRSYEPSNATIRAHTPPIATKTAQKNAKPQQQRHWRFRGTDRIYFAHKVRFILLALSSLVAVRVLELYGLGSRCRVSARICCFFSYSFICCLRSVFCCCCCLSSWSNGLRSARAAAKFRFYAMENILFKQRTLIAGSHHPFHMRSRMTSIAFAYSTASQCNLIRSIAAVCGCVHFSSQGHNAISSESCS